MIIKDSNGTEMVIPDVFEPRGYVNWTVYMPTLNKGFNVMVPVIQHKKTRMFHFVDPLDGPTKGTIPPFCYNSTEKVNAGVTAYMNAVMLQIAEE